MEPKSLLIGIISFIAGALLVSTAATTFEKPEPESDSMAAMIESLKGKAGKEFDQEFISQMIVHHEGAIKMAELAEEQAMHDEIKKLSKEIIDAQTSEIKDMKRWQELWDYPEPGTTHGAH